MYIKLAIQNMKKSIRNYVIYFVTITLTAAMMYSFLALGFSKEVLTMSENISMLTSGILGMSVLVALIASFVISYAIRFMLEERKKEFATYELLGMETSNIQKLFFIENGVIGMAAFFIGTFLGVGLSGVLVQIINHIFEMSHAYRISFSIKAFATAFIFFMFMYGIGILRAAKVIRRRKIVDMLYDHQKNENGKKHSLRFHITLIILSILCIFTGGCFLAKGLSVQTNVFYFWMTGAVILTATGIYEMYRNLPILLLRLLNKSKRRKYKDINLFYFGQIGRKVDSAGKLMAIIAILLTVSLSTMFAGLSMGAGYKANMDSVKNLSGFDRRLVCVPKFCPRECPGRQMCRYQRYLEESRKQDIFIQICNHNYLLADAYHRAEGYKPLLADYRTVIVDEAHKLPEAAKQMFGKNLCMDDIREVAYYLEREHQTEEARILRTVLYDALHVVGAEQKSGKGIRETFRHTTNSVISLWEGIEMLEFLLEKLERSVPKWIRNRLEDAKEVLECFCSSDEKYVRYLRFDTEQLPVLCAASREIPELLRKMLWDREEGISAILTSGTLKAGAGFLRTRQITGLEGRAGVQEYVAESPFSYERNCLLYLPKTLEHCRRGSREEAVMVADQIHSLICSTYGHTLVLFTSYTLMGSVYQILRDSLPFPMVEVWRYSQEEILRFKTMENGVLFAAGSCWEGVDFPGDMVSSLIIVKLPFAVPDPISEAEKETYDSLESYIQSIIVPDMQKKLRQGFGRAIRTETDTCVVSILDIRAVKGGKYHEDVMCALPPCRIAEELKEVQDFIRSRKGVEYYL